MEGEDQSRVNQLGGLYHTNIFFIISNDKSTLILLKIYANLHYNK